MSISSLLAVVQGVTLLTSKLKGCSFDFSTWCFAVEFGPKLRGLITFAKQICRKDPRWRVPYVPFIGLHWALEEYSGSERPGCSNQRGETGWLQGEMAVMTSATGGWPTLCGLAVDGSALWRNGLESSQKRWWRVSFDWRKMAERTLEISCDALIKNSAEQCLLMLMSQWLSHSRESQV